MPFNPPAENAAEFNRLCESLPAAVERPTYALGASSKSASDMTADAEVLQILARITLLTNELK